MESGFLLIDWVALSELIGGFYPCFNGIRVLTENGTELKVFVPKVSILVLMESGFLRYREDYRYIESFRFLSLF